MMVWPEYISLNDWAGSLVIDFPNEYLPMLEKEENFLDWAMVLANTGIFKRASIPSPLAIVEGQKKASFETWQEWAKIVYNIIMNYGRELPNSHL